MSQHNILDWKVNEEVLISMIGVWKQVKRMFIQVITSYPTVLRLLTWDLNHLDVTESDVQELPTS